MADKTDYMVKQGRFILGKWRAEGEIVALSAQQAKYLAPPYGNEIEPADAPAPADAD